MSEVYNTIDNGYNVYIGRGRSKTNDEIFDFLKTRITGKYLDIGCNTGTLLREVENGTGIDASPLMVEKAVTSGLKVFLADAQELPFKDKEFDTTVLSCVLEQCSDPYKALSEAIRISSKVIGVSPYPNKSQWGIVGGSKWVKSVIDPKYLKEKYKAKIEPVNDTHYYFEFIDQIS